MLQLSFDRGTVIARGTFPPALRNKLAEGLSDLLWDPRVECYRAPAFRYARLVSALRHAGVAYKDEVLTDVRPSGAFTPPALRSYQQAALLAWQGERRRGLVVLPTGSGKTRLACAAMALSRVPSVCLVPTRVLMHQWRAEVERHFRGPVGCLGDGERRIEHVTIATFEAAYRHMARLGSRFGLLVVDEAHHFGDRVRDEALEMCAAPWRLALTATAPAPQQLERLVDLIGPVVCELSIGDLAGQWLAAFDTVVLPVRLSADEQQRYARAVAQFRRVFGDFRAVSPAANWNDFVAMASRSEQGRAALAAFRHSRWLTSYPSCKRAAVAELLARHREGRVLIFTSDNATAYAIAREHLVTPITCDIGRGERDAALAAFRAGELRVLVSARVLNEGIDVPDAEVGIIVGGAGGEREHVQRVGRLLRPALGKRALVYELVTADTHEVRRARERRRALGASSTTAG